MRFACLLVMAGCRGCAPEDDLVEVFRPYDPTPSGVVVTTAGGESPLTIPVFATDLLGAPVPSADLQVEVNGARVSPTAAADGWASVVVEGTGPVTVEASAGVGEPALGAAWPRGAWSGAPGEAAIPTGVAPGHVALAGGGVVWSEGGELWWSAWGGPGPARVLDLAAPILGIDALHADGDGVTDLLAWSTSAVVLLRGRAEGGLALGGAWATTLGTIVQASIAPFDEGAELDLAVAVTDGSTSWVGWAVADGGGWTYQDTLTVPYEVWGLSAEDLDGNGQAEVSLLTADSLLRRYTLLDEAWVAASSGEFTLTLAPGSRLHPSLDMDGDGVEELVATGPDANGLGMQAFVISTPDRLLYRLFPDGTQPATLGAELRDLDGDGLPELVLPTDRDLYRAAWSATAGTYELRYADLPCPAPTTTGDIDGDAVPDVVLATSVVRALAGTREGGGWRLEVPTPTVLAEDVDVAPFLGELTGDARDDFLALADEGDELLWVEAGATPVEFGLRDPGVSLAVCAPWAYVLTAPEGDSPRIRRFHLPDLTSDWDVPVEGEVVACAGESAVVTGTTGATTWLWGDEPTSAVEVGDPTFAVAATDADGDGLGDTLLRCGALACDALYADLDGDGVDEPILAEPGRLLTGEAEVSWASTDTPRLSAYDFDGDTKLELLVTADDVVRIYRWHAAYGWSPAEVRAVGQPIGGPALAGDVDGDARVDLVVPARDSDAGDGVAWDGRLLHFPG